MNLKKVADFLAFLTNPNAEIEATAQAQAEIAAELAAKDFARARQLIDLGHESLVVQSSLTPDLLKAQHGYVLRQLSSNMDPMTLAATTANRANAETDVYKAANLHDLDIQKEIAMHKENLSYLERARAITDRYDERQLGQSSRTDDTQKSAHEGPPSGSDSGAEHPQSRPEADK